MGRSSTITPEQGKRLLDAYQRLGNKSAACREIGVSEDAGMRYLANAPKAAAPSIATQRVIIETASASLFDTTAALDENYQRLQRLITKLENGITVIDGEHQSSTPPATLVGAFREARGFIDSSVKMLELLVSVQEVRRFQQAILDVIASEVDEPTRERIFSQLRQRLPFGQLPA